MVRFMFSIATAVAMLNMADAYDIGCIYPEKMPDPIEAQLEMAGFFGFGLVQSKIETPMVVYRAHLTTYCQSNCVAHHDATALNVITKTSPTFRTPEEYHNSWSRAMCVAQCYGMLEPAFVQPVLAGWGYDMLPASTDLKDCDGDQECVDQLLSMSDWDPRLIGQIVASEVKATLADDGWNADGSTTFDWETGEAVPCTTNCAPYSDTTGYFPINHPGSSQRRRKLRKKKGKKGSKGGEDDKYTVEDEDAHWQPIQEHDGNGYFSRQEHVTPHIGFTVKPFLIDEWQEAPEPDYDFVSEAELVVERLRDLSSSDDQKNKVNFFDNKIIVRGLIQHYVSETFPEEMSFEDKMLFLHILSAAEHDALLQSWREKVRHDVVRPTTVIQRWGDDVLETFSGDPTATSPSFIEARDFQPYIRVMPHSEYPSGSACLCTAYAEFTDAFVKQEFDATSVGPMHVSAPGQFSNGVEHFDVCPNPTSGISFCSPDQGFVLQDMTELKYICGQSRLWGGMHFTPSVAAAEGICAGIGTNALDLYNELKASSTWGDAFHKGDPRPTCAI